MTKVDRREDSEGGFGLGRFERQLRPETFNCEGLPLVMHVLLTISSTTSPSMLTYDGGQDGCQRMHLLQNPHLTLQRYYQISLVCPMLTGCHLSVKAR